MCFVCKAAVKACILATCAAVRVCIYAPGCRVLCACCVMTAMQRSSGNRQEGPCPFLPTTVGRRSTCVALLPDLAKCPNSTHAQVALCFCVDSGSCADVCCLACMYASAPTCMPLQLRCLFSSACAATAGKARVRSVLSDQLVCITIACLWHAFYKSASGSNHVCLRRCLQLVPRFLCMHCDMGAYICMHACAADTLCCTCSAQRQGTQQGTHAQSTTCVVRGKRFTGKRSSSSCTCAASRATVLKAKTLHCVGELHYLLFCAVAQQQALLDRDNLCWLCSALVYCVQSNKQDWPRLAVDLSAAWMRAAGNVTSLLATVLCTSNGTSTSCASVTPGAAVTGRATAAGSSASAGAREPRAAAGSNAQVTTEGTRYRREQSGCYRV